MNKLLILTAALAFATTPALAGSLAGAAEEADPFVQEDPQGSGISPLIIGLGAAGVIAAIILLTDSSSSSGATTPPNNNALTN